MHRAIEVARAKMPPFVKESYFFVRAQRHILINISLVIVTVTIWQLYCLSRANIVGPAKKLISKGFNPCCAFPCRHGGVCTQVPNGFECDCIRTGYYGRTCHKPTILKWFEKMLCPTKEFIHLFTGSHPSFWKVMKWYPSLTGLLKKFAFLSQCTVIALPALYNNMHDYTTLDVFYNRTLHNRLLSPIPRNCPKAMGIRGPENLPNVTEVYDRLFKRERFIPCPKGTNVFFIIFNLFAHQHLYKIDYNNETDVKVGPSNIPEDGSMLYGTLGKKHNPLRSHHSGKLSMVTIDGEQFPTTETHNEHLLRSMGLACSGTNDQPNKQLSSISAPLYALTTLWAREHNTICDMLRVKYDRWDDDRLYATARLVVIGILTQITYSELLHHMNQDYVKIKYKPQMTHFTNIQLYNVYIQELMRVFEWHMQLPDAMVIDNQIYPFDGANLNKSLLLKYGLNQFLESMFNTAAGKITARNNAAMLKHVRKEILKESRDLRIQSFNNYRRFLSFRPYKHFKDFNSDPEIVQSLRDLYEHVDAVEFYSGLFADRDFTSITPETMRMIYNNWYMKWLMSSPIHHYNWWKPITFGGKQFQNMISKTTLKDFICRNIKGNCKNMHISFTVPNKSKGGVRKPKLH